MELARLDPRSSPPAHGRRARVLFTDGVSNVREVLGLVRGADRRGELELWASAPAGRLGEVGAADRALVEPGRRASAARFFAWCREVCAREKIDLLVPGRHREIFSARRAELAAAGTRVLVAARPEVLHRLERKDLVYEDLREGGARIPGYRVIQTLEGLDRAWAALRPRYPRLCLKPRQGIFGIGFAVLRGPGERLRPADVEDAPVVSLDTLRRRLARGPFERRQLLMQYLEGPERSVDCVAYQGSLVLAVSRVKLPDRQVMETAGPAIDVARRLCRRYRLDGLFNVQLRDARGRPHLLEINARMSGGLSYTASTGVILPYWAIMLHLGLRRPEDVPAPRPGAVVTTPAPGAGGARLSVG
jgi:hypothetical protein